MKIYRIRVNQLLKLLLANLFLVTCQLSYAQMNLKEKTDALQITFKGKADSVFFKEASGISFKLKKTEDNNWVKSIQIEEVEKLIIQYKTEVFLDGKGQLSEKQLWMGSQHSKLSKGVKKLKGEIVEDSIWSEGLKEFRKVIIYLPPKFQQSKKYDIIYFADGKTVSDYAKYVEQLIQNKDIQPLILIGIHSGSQKEMFATGDMTKNYRGLEYLEGMGKFIPGADTSRFANHMKLFCELIPANIENKYDLKTNRKILYGTSDGASFAVSTSKLYPNEFESIIAFSVGWELIVDDEFSKRNFPKFYLSAGALETDFHRITKAWNDILEKKGLDVEMSTNISYHDDVMWREEFLRVLKTM